MGGISTGSGTGSIRTVIRTVISTGSGTGSIRTVISTGTAVRDRGNVGARWMVVGGAASPAGHADGRVCRGCKRHGALGQAGTGRAEDQVVKSAGVQVGNHNHAAEPVPIQNGPAAGVLLTTCSRGIRPRCSPSKSWSRIRAAGWPITHSAATCRPDRRHRAAVSCSRIPLVPRRHGSALTRMSTARRWWKTPTAFRWATTTACATISATR